MEKKRIKKFNLSIFKILGIFFVLIVVGSLVSSLDFTGHATYQPSCTDTDGGEDYYTAAVATGLYGYNEVAGRIIGENHVDAVDGAIRMDYSLSHSVAYDHCYDSETDNQLNEAYCDSSGRLMTTGYDCPNGCENGRCKSSSNTPVTTTTTTLPQGMTDAECNTKCRNQGYYVYSCASSMPADRCVEGLCGAESGIYSYRNLGLGACTNSRTCYCATASCCSTQTCDSTRTQCGSAVTTPTTLPPKQSCRTVCESLPDYYSYMCQPSNPLSSFPNQKYCEDDKSSCSSGAAEISVQAKTGSSCSSTCWCLKYSCYTPGSSQSNACDSVVTTTTTTTLPDAQDKLLTCDAKCKELPNYWTSSCLTTDPLAGTSYCETMPDSKCSSGYGDVSTHQVLGTSCSSSCWCWTYDCYDSNKPGSSLCEQKAKSQENTQLTCTTCPDLNNDGVIDSLDLAILAEKQGFKQGQSNYDAKYDLNGDGTINLDDHVCVTNYLDQVSAIDLCPQNTCTKCPDLNGDGKIDVNDLTELGKKYQVQKGSAGYESRYDLNQDGVINIVDDSCVKPYFKRESVDVSTCPQNPCNKCPDVNDDGVVDQVDISIITNRDSAVIGDSRYIEKYDLNDDLKIDFFDKNCLTQYYSKKSGDIGLCPKTEQEQTKLDCSGCPDLDSDGVIYNRDLDLFDLQKSSGYSSALDLNNDGEIDLLDRVCVSSNYGKSIIDLSDCSEQVREKTQRLASQCGGCPDVDKDGEVAEGDIEVVEEMIQSGKYQSSLDINGDNKIDTNDKICLSLAMNKQSSEIDACDVGRSEEDITREQSFWRGAFSIWEGLFRSLFRR